MSDTPGSRGHIDLLEGPYLQVIEMLLEERKGLLIVLHTETGETWRKRAWDRLVEINRELASEWRLSLN